jgi:hypothetical protein
VDHGLNVLTPFGNWQGMDNGTLIPGAQTFNISFLEMQYPLIENFIIPWMNACMNTSERASSVWNYPFPRLDIAIKFYRSDYPTTLKFDASGKAIVYPNYIYYFDGVYPESAELKQLDQAGRK